MCLVVGKEHFEVTDIIVNTLREAVRKPPPQPVHQHTHVCTECDYTRTLASSTSDNWTNNSGQHPATLLFQFWWGYGIAVQCLCTESTRLDYTENTANPSAISTSSNFCVCLK